MEIDTITIVRETIKIGAIIFAFLHVLAGAILFRDMIRLNSAIKTKNSGIFTFIGFAYMAFLIGILLAFILII